MSTKSEIVRSRMPLWMKFALAGLILSFSLVSGVVAAGYFLTQRYEKNVSRANLLGVGHKPAGKVTGPLNILVIGSDSRSTTEYDPNDPSSSTAAVEGERSDTVMILHIPKKMDSAYVISIPRDTYVAIPPENELDNANDVLWEGGHWKLNAAYAWGGAPLLVRTVESLTGLFIDHAIVVDFASVRSVTEAVGGVDVYINQEVVDPRTQRTFPQGLNHLDGKGAEDYVRQRENLPGGDFDRIKRQQQYLHALISKVHAMDLVTDIASFDKLLRAVTGALTVDTSMPIRDMAWTLRSMREEHVSFLTLPIAGDDILDGPGSVVYVDEEQASVLFAAIHGGWMSTYVTQYATNDVRTGE